MSLADRLDVVQLSRAGFLRNVRIYLPPGYHAETRHYPVVYMFDGQNLFDPAVATFGKSWHVDRTIEGLCRSDPTLGAVVVGVDSPYDGHHRAVELSIGQWNFPVVDYPEYAGRDPAVNGTGEVTGEFLADVVKPYVEDRYRVSRQREEVAIAGSSMGGYMSLFMMARYPELFGVVLALSPAVFDKPMNGSLLRQIVRDAQISSPTRVYLDMGGREELRYDCDDILASLWPLTDAVRAAGTTEVVTAVFPDDGHDESAWSRRFPGAYLWGLHHRVLPRGTVGGP